MLTQAELRQNMNISGLESPIVGLQATPHRPPVGTIEQQIPQAVDFPQVYSHQIQLATCGPQYCVLKALSLLIHY